MENAAKMLQDRAYWRVRATQEERLAQHAASETARAVHAHLADGYRLRLEQSPNVA